MQLVFIRHGDPDYENDCLTGQGKKQALALSRYLAANVRFDKIYSSPMGRAFQTATTCYPVEQISVRPWLREFSNRITLPNGDVQGAWDFYPSYFCERKEFLDVDKYLETSEMQSAQIKEKYYAVIGEFDKLLAENGYLRQGGYYKAVQPNRKRIALFCHFGITCVLMSHLFNVPYVVLAQHFCASPTSITTVVTEERQNGIAQFRCIGFGQTPHLALDGQPDGFSARFCETFDSDERH